MTDVVAGSVPAAEPDEAQQFERLASAWAAEQPVASRASSGAQEAPTPATRLNGSNRKLRRAHQRFAQQSAATEADSYAAEWFLDNYYLIRESVRQVIEDLPPDFYRKLPRLERGAPLADAPRAQALAMKLLEECSGRVDSARLALLVEAYQRSAPLTMGELWALPSLLRLGLLEWLSESADILTSSPPGAVGGEDQSDHDQRVANCIVGLRTLKTTEWDTFFEAASWTERELRRDPSGDYANMTFETRDRYRKGVERIARRSDADELEVARAAVELAADAAGTEPGKPRTRHVGYYLVDRGVERLEHAYGYRRSAGERVKAWVYAHPTTVYLGSIMVAAAALILWGCAYAASVGASVWLVALVAVLLLVPALTVAVALVNYGVSHLLEPKLLPKLDFRNGVPHAHATAVVMPVLVGSRDEIDELLSQLERHYLGNPDPQLSFALLTDFHDADAATLPGESDLLEYAAKRIERLNATYGTDEGDAPFYLLHRGRRWNPREGVWMGWERKRGKLMELNHLLRGATDTTFELTVGAMERLTQVQYVLTLDADTRLPPSSAHRLIGTLAHPLNRAEFGENGRVVEGYSLLQPRTDVLPESANASRFSRLFVGENGLDLYTTAVSDVYQDLFGAAIFVGKGLYRLDDFERALEGRVPENSLLSHDLLEGIYGGVALVSDVVLYEEYPPTYLAQVQRAQRWVRGDWQLLPWLVATLLGVRGGGSGERLGLVGAWKIADNLRRSLLAPALFLLFLGGWLVLPGSVLVWTLIAISTLAAPLLASAVIAYVAGLIENDEVPGRRRLMAWQPLSQALGRFVITISFVPYEAIMVSTSVIITLFRLFVSHRNLLKWRTAAQSNRSPAPTLLGNIQRMAWALALTLATTVLLARFKPSSLAEAGVVLVLWFLAPLTAYLLSVASSAAPRALTAEERSKLHGLARRTWLYFESFVGPEDNWLPPDNVQLDPKPVTAHRTSPTNIGLMLLSTLAAHDLGYLGMVDLSLRLRQTLDVLDQLERHNGHLLNWYDTRSLEPLHPRYVSSVDSGNLAASLMALRQGCLALLKQPLDLAACFRGLADGLTVLEEVLTAGLPAGAALVGSVAELRERVIADGAVRERWPDLISYLRTAAWPALEKGLLDAMDSGDLSGQDLTAARLWSERVNHGIRVTLKEFESLAPWVTALGEARPWAAALTPGSPAAAAWADVRLAFSAEPALDGQEGWAAQGASAITALRGALRSADDDARAWCDTLLARLTSSTSAVTGLMSAFGELATRIDAQVNGTDFSFLFDSARQHLHIGYNVDSGRLDSNYYDLLASESRLASLVAIAKHDVPGSHWVHLNRPLGAALGRATLLSWSGTMFEYLMPPLLMRRYGGTLLEQSCDSAVDVQIAYGKRHGVPWGVSESGYARVDAAGNYQYYAFGVPDLALDRSYSGDLVIAPYASVLALPYHPHAVLENLDRLVGIGALGPHGFFEALDYTPSRKPLAADFALVRSHMAHHQGMALVALANALTGDSMVERFHADPRVATVELLLQERIPLEVPVVDEVRVEEEPTEPVDLAALDRPWPAPLGTILPLTQLLSNGSYTVLLSAGGGGWSAAGAVALTRWSGDGTRDADGTWLYLADEDGGAVWSATHQPLPGAAQAERVTFHPYMVEYERDVEGIHSHLEVAIGQDKAEVRRLTIVNRSARERRLRVTSYAEVVLGSAEADARHPAFSKLFVESRFDAQRSALIFRRRPRSASDRAQFAAHTLLGPEEGGACEFESDRATFLGRGNDVTTAVGPHGPLASGVGATLDPVMALAQPVVLQPNGQAVFTFITAFAESRKALVGLIDHLRLPGIVAREFGLARMRSRLEMRQYELTPERVESYQRLLSAIVYPDRELRAPTATLAANTLGQSSLWGQGISGDFPILLVRLDDHEHLPLVVELLHAHAYWRRRAVKVDLVVLNAKDTAYDQALHARLRWHLSRTGGDEWLNARGGIYLLRQDQLAPADLKLLESAATVLLEGRGGTLGEQLMATREVWQPGLPRSAPVRAPEPEPVAPAATAPEKLAFANGVGGFSADGREYVMRVKPGALPPAPWSNVMANSALGCLTTEAGLGPTWSVNSGENRLTPWSNDPVSDPSAEVVYLRDEETVEVWSATPHPAGADVPFEVRHGAGYTTYAHVSHGLEQKLEVSVAASDPVKLAHLRVRNLLDRPRRVTVTYYAEWVLGVDRRTTSMYVLPDYDPQRCAVLARNPYAADFGERVAFLASNKSPHGVTTDRREFLGALGAAAAPDALKRIGLSGATVAGADPCAVLQLHLDLPAGGEEEVLFVLGQAENRDRALDVADEYRNLSHYAAARREADELWDARLDMVQVTTPDRAFDLLNNRWLLYQTLSSRYFGRTAFYQPGGAYGFRDQLQDVVAVLHAAPELAREQLLRAAAHQFEEGDVLHWWHPPAGRGVRTRISDDLLWLVYGAERYVTCTGDRAVLDEVVPYLRGPALQPAEEDHYDLFQQSDVSGTLLDHCRRALEKGATVGRNGLPLMGSGDWNDGMNRVGIGGQGESVWLAWFLTDVIKRFTRLLDGPDDQAERERWLAKAEAYAEACEEHAWDGKWYRRAYFDDGTPLGSHLNVECQIDSIAQSWSVLSGAAPAAHAQQAMRAVDDMCVRRDDRLIRLFTPPFDRTPRDPGYIKGYLPGVRENGGQYTHGAIWSAWAFADLGDADEAHELHQLLNPVLHASDAAGVERYKVEPYVMTADVYSLQPHVGRGGWSWYTGSAAWYYRFGLEGLLGFEREGQMLHLRPRVPEAWPGFEVRYRYGASRYVLRAKRGQAPANLDVALVDDGEEHVIDAVYVA